MTQESIEQAREMIIDKIYNSNINIVDKLELMININHFLDTYEETTKSKVLKKKTNGKK